MQSSHQHAGLHRVVCLLDVIEEGVQFMLPVATPIPGIEQLIDALGDAASIDEPSLSWMQDRKACEDAAEAMSEDLVEQFAQATLQADRTQIAHAMLLECILEQRHNDARLPCSREGGCAEAG